MQTFSGNLIDILNRRIFPGTVQIENGKIAGINETDELQSTYLLPGFVDAHVHIESSMLTPAEFSRAAVRHGTVATVSDPHEIGNVIGVDGVRYMLESADGVPLKIFFGAPACVPATRFETAGAAIDAQQVAELLDDDRIIYLSEMMNYPGVLAGDAEVIAKIRAAAARGKPVDGHAPGVRGDDARRYFAAGISTDHECFTKEEALDKLQCGAKILIREGSAARNFEALYTLLDEYPDQCMLCSDDKHPDELLEGHIDVLVKRAVDKGVAVMNVLRAACVNPVLHYGLDVGLLRVGDDADFIEVDNLRDWNVVQTVIRGDTIARDRVSSITHTPQTAINQFAAATLKPDQLQCPVPAGAETINVIEALDGELITKRRILPPKIVDGMAVADTERDILKIAVANRYRAATPAVAFITNFGFRSGAIASSVAHDSHNIVAVGTNDEDLCEAMNLVIQAQGGLSLAYGSEHHVLPLPVAGLMSDRPFEEVAEKYSELDRRAKELGSSLRAPYMALSFMALLVIPEIKLSDKGLFDSGRFEFLPLFN
ncbi:MAG: adenine deaminase [Pirellulales bacterium]